MSRGLKGGLFKLSLLLALGIGFVTLGALLVDVFSDGFSYLDWTLLSKPPSSDPQEAGARPAIIATLFLITFVMNIFAIRLVRRFREIYE